MLSFKYCGGADVAAVPSGVVLDGPLRNMNVCRDVAGGRAVVGVCLATGANALFAWNGSPGYGTGWKGPAWNGEGWKGAGWNETAGSLMDGGGGGGS